MEEYLDIYTDDNQPTGVQELKDIAHQKGLFHQTVHIWFYTPTKEVLFQKRGAHKETFPNYWDVSVAGHVMAGETLENAALREIEEEIGLKINAARLQKIDVRKSINKHPNGVIDCEFQNIYFCPLNVPINALQKQDEEVDQLCLLSLNEFEFYTKNRHESFKLVPADFSYYAFVIETLKTTK